MISRNTVWDTKIGTRGMNKATTVDSDPEPVLPILGEHLLSSYVVRVMVRRGRWRISLQDVRTGKISHFDSFALLLEHLESLEPQLVVPDRLKSTPK